MNGYLINRGPMWLHAMKRAIGPGAKVPLTELYDQYGPKHELEKGQEFIEWLKNVKLRGNDNWHVEADQDAEAEEVQEETPAEIEERRIDITKINPKEMDIGEVVNLSVRQAREVIPQVTDLKLLKYSMSEARPRPGKESLCRILRKRIRELETQRR
jgi:hypothetical protein